MTQTLSITVDIDVGDEDLARNLVTHNDERALLQLCMNVLGCDSVDATEVTEELLRRYLQACALAGENYDASKFLPKRATGKRGGAGAYPRPLPGISLLKIETKMGGQVTVRAGSLVEALGEVGELALKIDAYVGTFEFSEALLHQASLAAILGLPPIAAEIRLKELFRPPVAAPVTKVHRKPTPHVQKELLP